MKSFRPLSGFILFLLLDGARQVFQDGYRFRPLSGFFLFLRRAWRFYCLKIFVSVPYRGSSYFYYVVCPVQLCCMVSVPYRGSSYFYSAISIAINDDSISFRPLSGFILFLREMFGDNVIKTSVSVPYRGSSYFYKGLTIV